MSTRLICPLLSCLLHAALLYAVIHISCSTPATMKSVSEKLRVVFIQPKQEISKIEPAAKPMLPPSPVEALREQSENHPQIPENTNEVRPAPAAGKRPAPKQIIKKKTISRAQIPEPKSIAQPAEKSKPVQQVSPPQVEGPPVVKTEAIDRSLANKTPQPAELNIVSLEQGYRRDLLEAIAQHKRYPDSARRRGLEGKTKIRFTLLQDGTLTKITIDESSGWRVLDQAAIKSLKRLQRFKPIPSPLKLKSLELIVSIRFSLE